MAVQGQPWLILADNTLHCREKLPEFDVDNVIDQGGLEEDCLTAESNVSLLSEDSFTSCSAPTCLSACKGDASGVEDIDKLLAEQEESNPCPSSYLASVQAGTGLSPVHRATVVDNMVSAAVHLGLANDALFTAVACLDRYLAAKPTPLPLLQPTAIACLWAAAKYEQLVVPPALQFAALVQAADFSPPAHSQPHVAHHLSKRLLVELEADVLAALDYRLASIVTVKSHKACLMQRLRGSKLAASLARRQLDQLYCMASYLTEVSLLEYRLLPAPPAQVAAAAFVYAFMLLGLPHCEATKLTGYTQPELAGLLEMFCALHTTLSAALQLRRPYNVTVKYCSPTVRSVAHIPPELRVEARSGSACGW